MTKFSRLNRLEERRAYKRFLLNLLGIALIICLVLFLGVPALINYSTLLNTFKGSEVSQKETDLLFPPRLEASYEATNSATINLSGYGQAGTTLSLFVNNRTLKTMLLPGDGQFTINDIILKEGGNKITATVKNSSGEISSPSETLLIVYRKTGPKLVVENPQDGEKINSEKPEIKISGKVEDAQSLTVNNRWIMVNNDGTFTYVLPLSQGENQIKIIAADIAGNQTTVERKVTYSSL